jgi:precorrin-2 methylase
MPEALVTLNRVPGLISDEVRLATLKIVGLGTGGPGRLTAEAIIAMDNASRIYHLSPLGSELITLYGDRVSSLEPLYAGPHTPEASYAGIVEFLVNEADSAQSRGQSICFASYGDALFMVDSTTALLSRLSTEKRFSVAVVPAVSAIGALRAMFPQELRGNFQCVDSNSISTGLLMLNSALPTIVTQVAEVGVRQLRAPVDDDALRRLTHALATAYGPEHPCTLAVAPWYVDIPPLSIATTCGGLIECAPRIHTGMSLVIGARVGLQA